MTEQLDVDQLVLLGISGLALQETSLGLFEAEGDGGQDISDHADEDHLDVGQDLRKTK